MLPEFHQNRNFSKFQGVARYMSCGQPSYNTSGTVGSSITISPGAPTAANSQILIVCDAPETIPQYYGDTSLPLRSQAPPDTLAAPAYTDCPPNTYTLYKTQVSLNAGPTSFRLFFWHLNAYKDSNDQGTDLNFLLSGLVTGDATAMISGTRAQIVTSDGSGLCVANASHYETLDPFVPVSSTMTQSGAVIYGGLLSAYGSKAVGQAGFLGGIVEFTLTVPEATTLSLRTSVTEALNGFTPSGSINDPVATPWEWRPGDAKNGYKDKLFKHVRGTWPYSSITLTMPSSYDVEGVYVPPGQQGKVWTFGVLGNGHSSPEMSSNGGFGQQLTDTYGTLDGNFGCYGADLNYQIKLTNGSSTNQYLGHLAMTAYTFGGETPDWFGAVNISAPSGYMQGGIVKIQANGPPPFATGSISVDSNWNEIGVAVPPGSAVQATISLQFAGGSSSPVVIVLTQGLNWTNPGGP